MPRTGSAARDRARPELRLELEEKLDAKAVSRVWAFVEHSSPEVLLLLDFGGVRDFDFAALAGLLAAVERTAAAHVALCGLCEQQARLLRYLGVDVSGLERHRAPAVSEQAATP